MNFSDYQKDSRKTALYPDAGKNIVYPTLGLSGEAGEIANKVKKIYRDDGGVLGEGRRDMLKKELGDVLWYVSQVATEAELDLNEIAELNLKRLFDRMDRGTLHGDGDNR